MENAHLNNGQIFLQSIHHTLWVLMQSNPIQPYANQIFFGENIGNLIRMDGF